MRILLKDLSLFLFLLVNIFLIGATLSLIEIEVEAAASAEKLEKLSTKYNDTIKSNSATGHFIDFYSDKLILTSNCRVKRKYNNRKCVDDQTECEFHSNLSLSQCNVDHDNKCRVESIKLKKYPTCKNMYKKNYRCFYTIRICK